MTGTQLFPDIRLLFGMVNAHAADCETEMSLCISGSCEYCVNGEYFYLTAGSCIIRGGARTVRDIAYSPDYRGITLLTDTRCVGSDDVFGIREQLAGIGENEMRVFRAGDDIRRLAEQFAIAPHTLKAEFSRYFGSSVYSYTKLRKMFRAAELICTADMKIIDIAEEVGYCNASKFSSAFRSVMGTAPKDYRTEHKAEKNA